MVRRLKGQQLAKAGDWPVTRRTRSSGLLPILLVLAVGRSSAAQIATSSFADLEPYRTFLDAIFTAGSASGETPGQAKASLPFGSVFPTPPDASAGFAQAAVDAQAPVVSLSALSSRVKPFETIYVRKVSGEDVAGTFSGASETSLTMQVDGQTRDIPVSDVQQVWLRGGTRVKRDGYGPVLRGTVGPGAAGGGGLTHVGIDSPHIIRYQLIRDHTLVLSGES